MAPAGFPRPRFPGPLVVARGHPRPQADGRLAVPKRRLSGPHSATNRAAPRWSTPGMVSSTARAWATGRGGPGASPPPALATSPVALAGSGGDGVSASNAPRPRGLSTLSTSIGSSRQSLWATCRGNSRRWWSRIRPVSACSRRGSFVRIRPGAHAALVAGSARPCIKAANIARPDRPLIAVATAASVIVARSSTPGSRCTARRRSCPHVVRSRVRSRRSRWGGGACSSPAAGHRACVWPANAPPPCPSSALVPAARAQHAPATPRRGLPGG
jgi:hypothetical protein